MIDEVNYGSLITTTKCYGCIHFPLCIEQNGRVNLGFASENDCCYYQSKLPDKDSIVLSMEEFSKALTDNFNMGKKESQFYSERVAIPTIRKETAEKIYLQAKAIVDATKHIVQGREYIHIDALKEIIKNCGGEIEE